jgi:LAO/AO transport system kinase
MLAGAGDELQGMKRGIMELADLVAITKADGPNQLIAEGAKITFQNAIHLFPPKPSGWSPQVITCSAHKNTGITELWAIIMEYVRMSRKSGYFEDFRKQQAIIRMHSTILEYLRTSFYNNETVKSVQSEIEDQLTAGNITSYQAAVRLLDKYLKRR